VVSLLGKSCSLFVRRGDGRIDDSEKSHFGVAAGCPVTFAKADFEPLKTNVGIGPITTGIVEGKGEIENDKGKVAATASGEMTLGQYTELGVNQGSAKGVFKIQ
jgi:hypothetical protein